MDLELICKLCDYVSDNQRWYGELRKLFFLREVTTFHEKGMNYALAAAKELKVKPTWQERDAVVHYIYGDMLNRYRFH